MLSSTVSSIPSWERLAELFTQEYGALAGAFGAAAAHQPEAREEVIRLLIAHHQKVLNDVLSTDPLTQHELERVPGIYASFADMALRESCRRLLGHKMGVAELNVCAYPATPVQAAVWLGVYMYFDQRIQCTPEEKPGRKPDMSVAAAGAWRAVLSEIGDHRTEVGEDFQWIWEGPATQGAKAPIES